MENEEIIKKYFSLIERIKRDYFFLNLSSKEYMDIVDKAIKISKEELGDQEDYLLYGYLKDNLEILLRQETGKQLRNDSLNVLNSYFKTLVINTSSYEVFSRGINKFFDFLNNYNVKLKSNDIDSLLKNNQQAYLLAKGIFKYLKEIKLTSLGKDINLNTMLLSYYLVDENSLKLEDAASQDTYSREEVRKVFAWLIYDFKKKFAFLEIKDIDSLVDKAIDESLKVANGKDDFNNILRQHLEENFLGLSRGALEEKLNDTLEKYFNSLEIDISNFASFSKILRNVLYFLNKNNVDLRLSDIGLLVKNTDNLRLLGSGICEYLEQIKKSSIYNNNNLRTLLEAYFAVYKNTFRLVDTEKKSLYEFYEGYSKDEVDKALKMLSLEEIELLRERYAADGSYLENGSTSKKIDNLLKKDIPGYLERIVKQEKEEVIYRLFPGIDKSLVDVALKRLPLSYQDKIAELKKIYYQQSDDTIFDNKEFKDNIYPYLLNILSKLSVNSLEGLKDQKSLLEIFDGHSESQIKRIISYLPKEERSILTLKYNRTTLKVRSGFSGLNEEYARSLDELINKKMMMLLQKETARKPLTEKINKFPKEEIKRVVEELSEEKQELFYLRYDKDLNLRDDYEALSHKTKCKISILLNKIIVKLNRGSETKFDGRARNFYHRLGMHSKEKIDKAINCLPLNDRELYHLCYDENGDALASFYTLDKDTKLMVRALALKVKYIINKNSDELGEQQSLMTLYQFLSDYSKEEIATAIERLSEEEKVTFDLRFDELGNTKESYRTLDIKTKMKIKNLLIKIKKMINNKSELHIGRKVKNLYSRLEGYSKEEVDLIIKALSLKEQQILVRAYDQDGNPTSAFFDMDNKDKQYISNLFLKIKKYLRLGNTLNLGGNCNVKNFYNRFKVFSKEEIDRRIKYLPLKDQQFLASVYDKDGNPTNKFYELSSEEKKHITNLILKIKRYLKPRYALDAPYGRKRKNFYNRFNGFSKEEIDIKVKELSLEEQQFIACIYDSTGKMIVNALSKNSERRINYLVVKIKNSLQIQEDSKKAQAALENNADNFYTNFESYDKKQVDEAKRSLPISYQELLNSIYDERGNLRVSKMKLTSDIQKALAFIVKNINGVLESTWKNEYNKKLVYFIKTNRVLNEVNDILNNDLVMIIIMKYGYLDKAYSLEEIAKMTNYSLEEVEKLIQLFLKVYQSPKVGFDNDLTSVFDEEIEVHKEEKVLIKALK